MRTAKALLVCLAAACATPSFACDNYPGLPTLPGETAEANKARNDRLHESLSIIRDHEIQNAAFNEATRIYLARVLKREVGTTETPLFAIEVEPAHVIKGQSPARGRKLSDVGFDGCESWGGGEATNALVGDWVIVFEGLPTNKRNPHGVYSILASHALIWGLVEQVEKFSLDRGGQRL